VPFKSLDFQRKGFNYRETLSMTVCGSSARNSSEKSKSGQSVGSMGRAEPLQEPGPRSILTSRAPGVDLSSYFTDPRTMTLIGKICPHCEKPGSVLYTTKERIVYQCPSEHQYETKLRKSSIATPTSASKGLPHIDRRF
jgi:hypothetical protein